MLYSNIFCRYQKLLIVNKKYSNFLLLINMTRKPNNNTNSYRKYSGGVQKKNNSSSKNKSIDWIFPILRSKSSSYVWYIASTITVATVGIISKLFLKFFNKTHVHNASILQNVFDKRPSNVPLITISNHDSCFDDPGLWVLLKARQLCTNKRMRWSLAAHDICFTQALHSYFFMFGKCVPVVRGNGIYQQAVNYCIEKLSNGEWVHIFPEGKVNMTHEYIRFKWGVARMILESPVVPLIVPIWHLGMETVLPNEPPYYLRTNKSITFNVGSPINIKDTLDHIKTSKLSDEESRILLTKKIQDELYKLKQITEKLHSENTIMDKKGS